MNLEGNLTWAFEFENEPWFAGFRALATNGVDLPVLNVFRLWSQMHGQRLPVTSAAGHTADEIRTGGVPVDHPDVSALASVDGKQLYLMAWHYLDDDLPGPAADVTLNVTGLTLPDGPATATGRRIDGEHGNSYAAWQRMRSPQPPTAEQKAALIKTSVMVAEAGAQVDVKGGRATVNLAVPRQGVVLVTVSGAGRT